MIVLTTFELDEYVVAAMRAGASGFLDKGVDPDVLLDAIPVVAGGDALLTPRATRALLGSMSDDTAPAPVDEGAVSGLTGREREVVAMVGRLDDGVVADFRLAAGSVAPTPVRLGSVEEALVGRPFSQRIAWTQVSVYVNIPVRAVSRRHDKDL